MAAATFTLTGDLAALVGSATKRGAYVQLDRPVTDPTNDIVYEMTSRTTVEGSFSLPTLPALNALNNSGAAFNMVVTIGSRKWLVPAQSAASTHDLTEFTETTGVVPPNPITYALRAPDYVTGRAYVVGELVTYSGTLYRITTAYTSSGGSLDLTKATAIGGGGGGTGQPLQQVATTVTASGAAVANKHNPADATAAARTISLPTGQAEGTQISVEKTDSSTNTVAITGNIRGVAASTISLAYLSESLMLRADSAGSWWPIAGHRTKSSLDAAYGTGELAYAENVTGTAQTIASSATAGGGNMTDIAGCIIVVPASTRPVYLSASFIGVTTPAPSASLGLINLRVVEVSNGVDTPITWEADENVTGAGNFNQVNPTFGPRRLGPTARTRTFKLVAGNYQAALSITNSSQFASFIAAEAR